MGASASPGYDGPKVNKDYEIMKLRKRIEKFECENELLKISGGSCALHTGNIAHQPFNVID